MSRTMERRTPVRLDGSSTDGERRAELEFGAPLHGKHSFAFAHALDLEPTRPRSQVIGSRTKPRFMESPLAIFAVHWDHELPCRCSAGVLACEFAGRPARRWFWWRDATETRRRGRLRYLTRCGALPRRRYASRARLHRVEEVMDDLGSGAGSVPRKVFTKNSSSRRAP